MNCPNNLRNLWMKRRDPQITPIIEIARPKRSRMRRIKIVII
jgi:hypothetical protein